MDIALISAVVQLLTAGYAGKNIRLRDTRVIHSPA